MGDPRVEYDARADRWIIVAVNHLAGTVSSPSGIFLAISDTGDPRGQWRIEQFTVDTTNLTYADFPKLGLDQTWISVQFNRRTISQDAFQDSVVMVFDRAKSEASGSAGFQWTLTGQSSTHVPAVSFDINSSGTYLVANWNGDSQGMGFLKVWNITSNLQSPELADLGFVALNNTWDSGANGSGNTGLSEIAPQLGSNCGVDLDSSAVNNVVLRNGHLYVTQAIFVPAGGSANLGGVQWCEIETRPGASFLDAIRFGRRVETGDSYQYGFPSIAVNSREDVLIGYSYFSPSIYPSAGYSYVAGTDSDGSLLQGAVLKEGEAPYCVVSTGAGAAKGNRWGDISATVVDPSNDLDFWTIQEYAASPVQGRGRWGTWWGKVSASSSVGGCIPGDTTLCIDDQPGDRRFQLQVHFSTTQGGGSSGSGHAIPLSSLGVTQGGLFWFFSASNPELLVKVLDACSFANSKWVFASAGTNVGVVLTVTDTTTGIQRIYTNPDLHEMDPIADTAFSTCP